MTLQPIRRYHPDAAILFADILLIPFGMGQKLAFVEGEGPVLEPIRRSEDLGKLDVSRVDEVLAPVMQTVRNLRRELPADVALIGFAGAPWTVATYMIEGRGSDRSAARRFAYDQPETLDALLDVLIDATARYLIMQAKSGAQALKIFESWAEGLAEDVFERIVIRPHREIVARVRAAGVTAPFIGFPRGAGALVETYAAAVPVEGVALDTQASAALGRRLQAGGKTIQGALDNLLLRAGGPALDARVEGLLAQWSGGPYIFNLGHGVMPDTPIEHIARVVGRVSGKPVKAMAAE